MTFLMVFVIQNTQNRDGGALQAKLDELIRSSHAHNRFIGIEHLTDEEIEEHRQSCAALAKKATERAIARQHRSAHISQVSSFVCFWHNDCYRMRTEANEPVSAIDRRVRAQISALVEYLRRIQEK